MTPQEARDAGMAKVATYTNPEWKQAALQAFYDLAKTRLEFSSDEVWTLLSLRQVESPDEPRALGPVAKIAIETGLIKKTRYDQSTRPERHCAPVQHYVGAAFQ